jgi:hypothetical protein
MLNIRSLMIIGAISVFIVGLGAAWNTQKEPEPDNNYTIIQDQVRTLRGDRLVPVRVIPMAEPPKTQPIPPPVVTPPIETIPEPKEQAPAPIERRRRHSDRGDICQRHNGWKVVTNGGRSWRCAFKR